jgi:hypothetical protein
MAKVRKAGAPIPVAVGGITFTLHVPSAQERMQLRQELAELGARSVGPFAVLAQLREAVRALLPDPDDAAERGLFEELIGKQVELVTNLAIASAGGGEVMQTAWQDMLRGQEGLRPLVEIVRRAAPAVPACRSYIRMVGEDAVYTGVYGLAAAKWLLDRIEGGSRDYRRRHVGQETPAEVLDAITDLEFERIAWAVRAAAEVTEADAKNSVSPSAGNSVPESSTAASEPPPTTPSTTTLGTSTSSDGPSSGSIPAT